MNRGIARGLRIGLVGVALWLLWVEWRPSARPWPEDLARPETAGALRALPVGRDFLISGHVEPLSGESVREWQGRFVFRHRQRQDQSSSGGKTVRVVTVAEHRPALRWVGPQGNWIVPADSYGLDYAPRIAPRFWPRKWLWMARVDDWDRSSTGFRAGEPALAMGRIASDGQPLIVELLPGTSEQAEAQWQAVERPRAYLMLAVKLGLSLVTLAWLLRRRPTGSGKAARPRL
ncbi:MAG TPA: hypothetical protein PKY38_03515 [Opitutaceae bacterium]|nr:hypothetical protein [Opitutaceae bacterium]